MKMVDLSDLDQTDPPTLKVRKETTQLKHGNQPVAQVGCTGCSPVEQKHNAAGGCSGGVGAGTMPPGATRVRGG